MNKSAQLSPKELELIKTYLKGGLATGAGIGALLGVGNMAMDLRRQQDTKAKEDDDTLFLTLPKQADTVGPLAIGTGLAGTALSLLAANALVRKLYQNAKRKEVQKELDTVQNANISRMDEASKRAEAQRPLGPAEAVSGGAVAMALLTALASGAISYRALNKYFPAVKTPANPLPKRVKIMQGPVAPGPEEAKEAAANELLVRYVLSVKNASTHSLGDLVAAASQGRLDEMESTLRELDADALFATCKGASQESLSKTATDLAIAALVKSAMLAPVVAQQAAAEFREYFPALTATAWALPDQDKQALYDFGAGLGVALTSKWGVEKYATAVDSDKSKDKGSNGDPRMLEKLIRKAILDENEVAQPRDLETLKKHMTAGSLVNGISGESSNSVDAAESKDARPGDSVRQLQEAVMGV